jgi:hypothetical protein
VQLGLGPSNGAAARARLDQMISQSRDGAFAKTAGGIVINNLVGFETISPVMTHFPPNSPSNSTAETHALRLRVDSGRGLGHRRPKQRIPVAGQLAALSICHGIAVPHVHHIQSKRSATREGATAIPVPATNVAAVRARHSPPQAGSAGHARSPLDIFLWTFVRVPTCCFRVWWPKC